MELQHSLAEMAARDSPSVVHRSKLDLTHYHLLISSVPGTVSFRMGALFIVLFRCLLRVSEALALKREHVSQVSVSSYHIWLAKSKTDQKNKGHRLLLDLSSFPAECFIWNRFLASLPGGHVFVFQSATTGFPITYNSARDWLAHSLQSLGLQSCNYTFHSFRGGRASAALEAGVDPETIMLAGRWRSYRSFAAYLRPFSLDDIP